MILKNIKIQRVIQKYNYSCVPACLEQLLKFYNKKDTQDEILSKLKYPEMGMSLPRAGIYLILKKLKPIGLKKKFYWQVSFWLIANQY